MNDLILPNPPLHPWTLTQYNNKKKQLQTYNIYISDDSIKIILKYLYDLESHQLNVDWWRYVSLAQLNKSCEISKDIILFNINTVRECLTHTIRENANIEIKDEYIRYLRYKRIIEFWESIITLDDFNTLTEEEAHVINHLLMPSQFRYHIMINKEIMDEYDQILHYVFDNWEDLHLCNIRNWHHVLPYYYVKNNELL